MIVEIRNAGFVNKGAELMLYAVMQKIQDRYTGVTLAMTPSSPCGSRPFHKVTRLGIYPKLSIQRLGKQWGNLACFLPKTFRERYGLVLDSEIDAVLDISGFSYSDQFGVYSSKELARSSRRWRKNGTKLFLLPQALGPFQRTGVKPWVNEWAANADLIFAREANSYKYLTELSGERAKIKIAPDFTNLVCGILPEGYDVSDKRIALVPNYRMVDKTEKEISEAYLPFMARCAKYLAGRGGNPFVLVHEGVKDQLLAEEISDAAGGIPIVNESNPLHIKGILGSCDATIGSRFHGLVSALSQGIPSLGTGWTHKYIQLFNDYGFEEGMVSVRATDDDLCKNLELILKSETLGPLKRQLKERSEQLKRRSEDMWQLVFSEMDKIVKS